MSLRGFGERGRGPLPFVRSAEAVGLGAVAIRVAPCCVFLHGQLAGDRLYLLAMESLLTSFEFQGKSGARLTYFSWSRSGASFCTFFFIRAFAHV